MKNKNLSALTDLMTVQNQAISDLKMFAKMANFQEKMILVFGQNGNTYRHLQTDWLNDGINFPPIEILTREQLAGAYGAFSKDTGYIYLAQELMKPDLKDLAINVLLEEYGHFVDSQINKTDSQGDEGAIFSSFVQGKTLSAEQLQQLQTEDDSTTINLHGQDIQVEQASVSDSGHYEGSNETLKLDSKGGGTVTFYYEHYTIPDQFIIRYEGKELLNTGFVGGSRSGTVDIPKGNSNELQVIVATNDEGTAWDYHVETSTSGINIKDAYVAVGAGSNQKATMKFQVTLSEASKVQTTVKYFTLLGTASDGSVGSDKADYKIGSGTVTFAPGETSKDIEITVLGDKPIASGGDANFEILAKNIAYNDWKKGNDIDTPKSGDLGYRVDKFFDGKADFQAVGLTSDEKFFVLLSDPTNGDINKDSSTEKTRLLSELSDAFGGDTQSQAYKNAESKIESAVDKFSSDKSWTFATGTIYDQGKPPVLTVRGTFSLQDVLSDANPAGVGYDQFTANKGDVETWLNKVSQPKDTNLSFKPDITGHSLGGALTQWIAADYYAHQGQLGDIVTFNSPGISKSAANGFSGAESVTHYITSTDVVSMAGWRYITGDYTLVNQSDSFLKHGLMQIDYAHTHSILTNSANTVKPIPANLAFLSGLSTNDLSSPFFTYLPDPDYFAFQLTVSKIGNLLGSIAALITKVPLYNLGTYLATQLTYRGTAEANREAIGKLVELISNGIQLGKDVISAVKVAYDAAAAWSSAAWDAVTHWGESAWNAASHWTAEAWNTVKTWSVEAWHATTQWTADAWDATTHWTGKAWDATKTWSDAAWQATTKWTADAWDATTQWTASTWTATETLSHAAWDAMTNLLSKDWSIHLFSSNAHVSAKMAGVLAVTINTAWDAMNQWSSVAWEATQKWSDAAWNATTKWSLDVWKATVLWTPENWKATAHWTDSMWEATAGLNNKLGDALIFGTLAASTLNGGSGNDIMDGLGGNDVLNGGTGNDILLGGLGNDVLNGGASKDSFVFSSPAEGIDTIEDFKSSEGDRIVISATGFGAGLTPDKVIDTSQFVLGTAAVNSNIRFIYNPGTTKLFFDPDGSGSKPQQQIAILSGAPKLNATDIFVSGQTTVPSIKLTSPDNDVSGSKVTIKWNASDVDSTAKISLFYDTNNQGFDGVLITNGINETDGSGSFIWNTESLPKENYFIYAKIVDEKNATAFSYAKGQVQLKTLQQTDLSVTQAMNSASVGVGDAIKYTIKITNNGSVIAKNVVLNETLQESVSFVSASLIPTTQKDNVFNFNLGDIPAHQTNIITISAIAPNFADTVLASSVVSSETTDNKSANNRVSVSTKIIAPKFPDLAVVRSTNSTDVATREHYNYTLTVTNKGLGDATGVVLTEFLPSEVNAGDINVNSKQNVRFDVSNSDIKVYLGNLKTGASASVDITASSEIAGNLNSIYQVSSDQTDNNPLDNLTVGKQIVNPTAPKAIDLELTQIADNPSFIINDHVTLMLTLTNKGPGSATAIKVQDILPEGLKFVSANAEQGVYDSKTGIWDVGNMRDNLSRTLEIKASITGHGSSTNTAEVVSVFEKDLDSVPNNHIVTEDDITTLSFNSAPVITSNGGKNDAILSIIENNKAVTKVIATDTDKGTVLSFSLNGGVDASLFSIDNKTGTLAFKNAPDFEKPTDNNKDNVYEVVVKVSDGSLTDTQNLKINVTNMPNEINGSNNQDILFGSANNDFINAFSGNDIINTLAGNDTIHAGDGNDLIDAGTGNDFIYGEAGNDILKGGTGADIFYLLTSYGHDVVTDFDSQDKIGILSTNINSFADVQKIIVQNGNDAVVKLNGVDELTLKSIGVSTLNASDFVFA